MSEYVGNKKEMNFKSIESLNAVHRVIDETNEALKDKSRKIDNSPISEVLAGALGGGAGIGIGFAALYYGGSVVGLSAAGITSGLAAAGGIIGGGMAAGIAVLAAPAVILSGVGIGVASYAKYKKLKNAKELTYQEAIKKQNAILQALKNETEGDKERIEYLNSLNILLQKAIDDLKFDLGL